MPTPSLADPLKLLRDCFSRSLQPTFHSFDGAQLNSLDTLVVFISFPNPNTAVADPNPSAFIFDREAPTGYLSKRGTSTAYTIDSIMFVLDKRDDGYTDYLQAARQAGIGLVSLADRKDLLEYVMGQSETSTYLDQEYPGTDYRTSFGYEPARQQEVSNVSPSTRETGQMPLGKEHGTGSKSRVSFDPAALLQNATRTTRSENADSLRVYPAFQLHEQFLCSQDLMWTVDLAADTLKRRQSSTAKPSLRVQTTQNPGQSLSRSGTSLLEEMQMSLKKSKPVIHGPPIIILPSGYSALLSMYNARMFLGDEAKYVSAEEARGGTKDPVLYLKSPLGTHHTYQFIDTVARLSTQDWQRVLGVVVSGEQWQFKDWKVPRTMCAQDNSPDPIKILLNIAGFYFHWDDDKDWARPKRQSPAKEVEILSTARLVPISISRTKRHADKATQLQFWRALDEAVGKMVTVMASPLVPATGSPRSTNSGKRPAPTPSNQQHQQQPHRGTSSGHR